MKIKLKGIITEVGSNYETNDTVHSGAIIQQNGQNLHFDLPAATVAEFARHLFEHVTITITTEKQKNGQPKVRPRRARA
jgi:hypothetical protein